MKLATIFLALFIRSLCAQTVVFLRDGPPGAPVPAIQICAATNPSSGPVVVTTCQPDSGSHLQVANHGLPSGCGTTQTCWVTVHQMVTDGAGAGNTTLNCPAYNTGTGGVSASYTNGVKTAAYVSASTLALYDLTGVPASGSSPHLGTAVPSTGNFCKGDSFLSHNSTSPGQYAWLAQVSPYTMPSTAEPAGWLDGQYGNFTRKLMLATGNGLQHVTVALAGANSNCSISPGCNITVSTSGASPAYDPTAAVPPVQATATSSYGATMFGVFGTASILDSTNAGSCAGTGSTTQPLPYSVASVTTTGWTSNNFTCSIPTGDYVAVNNTCVSRFATYGTGSDSMTGTASCTVISQIAYHGNEAWDAISGPSTPYPLSYLDDSSNAFKAAFDGGSWYTGSWPVYAIWPYGVAAIRSMVDWSNANLFRDIKYVFNEIELTGGVSWPANNYTAAGDLTEQQGGNYGGAYPDALILNSYGSMASSASLTKWLNKHNNDIWEPGNQCSTQGVETSGSTGMYAVVASGTSTGTPTGTTLPVPSCTGILANEIVAINRGTTAELSATGTWGRITSCAANTITVSGGWNGSLPGTATAYAVFAVGQWSTNLPASDPNDIAARLAGAIASPIATPTVISLNGTYSSTVNGQYLLIDSEAFLVSSGGTTTTPTVTGGQLGTTAATHSSNAVVSVMATVTLTGTSVSTLGISVGDAVEPGNTWGNTLGVGTVCKVFWVGTSTLVCLGTPFFPSSLTSTPQMIWHLPAIDVSSTSVTSSVGMCGRHWEQNYWVSQYGSSPALYQPVGGGAVTGGSGAVLYMSNQQSSVGINRLSQAIAAAPFDARAVNGEISLYSTAFMDFTLSPYMSYSTAPGNNGVQYSAGIMLNVGLNATVLSRSFPTFPSLGAGPWLTDQAQYAMFIHIPTFVSSGNANVGQPLCIGAVCGNSSLNITAGNFVGTPVLADAPSSSTSQYLANWLDNINGTCASSLVTDLFNPTAFLTPLFIDPRILRTSSYKSQPLQYIFSGNNHSSVAGLTGWGSPESLATASGLAFVSRTGFGNCGDSSHYTDTVLVHRQPANIGGGSHDNFGLETHLFKGAKLIANDGYANVGGGGGFDLSINGSAVRFGGAQSSPESEWNASQSVAPDVPGGVVLDRWLGANAYGDPSSNVALQCADSALSYVSTWNVTAAMRCVADLKQSQEAGYDHFVFEQDYDTTTSAESIARSIHYPQNGCSTCGEPPDQSDVNGSTFCISSSNTSESCTNFATDGRIESIESGVGTATFGVMSQIYPVTSGISLTWDCPGSYSGGVQAHCAPGLTYSGGYGFSNRVSATVSSGTSLEVVTVHKIMQSLTDTTFSTAPLSASGWTGAEACGTSSCAAYFGYRGTGTATVPAFTTSLETSKPHQYIVTGVPAGTYHVSVASTTVLSGYTVSPGDNTIAFTVASGTTAGVVSLSTSTTCSITTTTLPNGAAGTAYSQTAATSNCTSPVAWTVSAGTLCAGLSLGGATGTVSGTPTGAQTCSFTVQAVDAVPNTGTQALSIVITGPPPPTKIVGQADAKGNVIIH
jgi:hypothetical protein